MSKLVEKLASEFPQLEPSLVSDVWHASFGNMSHVRDQLKILANGFCEDESSTFGDSSPIFLNVTTPDVHQHHVGVDQTVHIDQSSAEVEIMSHIKDSTEAPGIEAVHLTLPSKGNEHPTTEDIDTRSRALQLLQLMESFGEIGGDVVSSVFDSCQNDIEKAVTKLSEMTESMGIERYVVLKPGDEGFEQIAVAMTAVFLTSGSLESLINSCAHITDFGGRATEVIASPIIVNSYPCVAEDLCCPFGELAYLKIIGWGRSSSSLCAIIQCDVLKFEENPARIKLSLPPEPGVFHLAPVESEGVELFQEIKPFWITGRICAQLSNGLICDEWPPKGYVDPFFLDQDTDDQQISESCSAVSDPSPVSVHTLSTVSYGVNVDLDSVDGHMSILEYLKQDGPSSRSVAHLDSAETDNLAIEISRFDGSSPGQDREMSTFFDCDVNSGDSKNFEGNGPDFTGTERQGAGATLASESRDFVRESSLSLSVAMSSNQSEAGTASQMSSSRGDEGCEVVGENVDIAVQVSVGIGASSAIAVAEVASDRACVNEDTSVNRSGALDQDCGACSSSCGQVVICEGTVIPELEAVQVVAEFGGPSSGEADYLPPWLRDQDDGLHIDPADNVMSAGLDACNQQLHGPSEALSFSSGFLSCCVPWLKEDWSLQTTDALVLDIQSDSNVSNLDSYQSDETRETRLTSNSLSNPECSTISANQKSPACAPVSALVWAEAIASVNEMKPLEVDDSTSGLSKRPSLTAYKNIGEPDSPICVPVSALVWGEALALSCLSAGSYNAEIAMTQHPSLSLGQGTVASHSMSLEAGALTSGCDLHSIVRASHEEDALPIFRKGQSRLRSDSIPEVDSFSFEMSSGGDARLDCGWYEYIGDVRDNKPHGWGLQKFKGLDGELSGLTYRGNFVDGLAHCSRGVAVWSSGLEFCGEFNHGCPITGSLTEPDGTAHRALFPQTESGFKLLSDISERHILEAISRGKNEACDLKEFQDSCCDQADAVRQDQMACSPRVNDGPGQTEECKSEYEQQFGFLRNLFPDCEEPVITGILEDCGGDVGKAIEFLLPAEDVRAPQEKKRRGRRMQPVLLPKSGETDQAVPKNHLLSSGWAAQGDLARRLNVTSSQEQLAQEFPGLSVRDVEEAFRICGGDIDETRQQLLILEMSRRDPSSSEAGSFGSAAKSSLWASDGPGHGPPSVHASFGCPKLHKMVETHVKDRAGSSVQMFGKEEEHPLVATSASAAAEAEAWRVSTSKRARDARPNPCARVRFPAEQYEGMGGDELRRLGFQHAKMNADLSRMAVAAFQAGDRIEAARLSEKALRHQEQFQVLNELARARIIETFNPDMDGRLCVDLHHLFVAEALELLEAKLRQWAAGAAGRRLLVDVVTGAGNHSREGRAVLRPRVKAWLEERGMRYYPINDGMLKVDVSTFPRG